MYFGNGAYGVEAAAEQYFGKPIDQIGARARPRRSPGSSRRRTTTTRSRTPMRPLVRRNTVLDKMRELGDVTPARARHGGRRAARDRADAVRTSATRPPTSSTR